MNGRQFVKVNSDGLLMMSSTFSCPHGNKIAGQWVYCFTCDNDHGYFDYNNITCACENGYNYRSSDAKCFACPANSGWDSTAQSCKCAANYYMMGDNQACNSCPINTTSPIGSTSISDCACGVGYAVNSGTSVCEVSGTYSSTLDIYYDNTNCSDPIGYLDTWTGCGSLDKVQPGENVTSQQLAAKTVCLVDRRDHRAYRVRKFVDNKCWLIDSLRFGGDYSERDGCSTNSGEGNFTYAWCGGSSVSGCTAGGAGSSTKAQETFSGNYYGHCRQNTVDNNYLYDYVAALQNTSAYSSELSGIQQGVCPSGWHVPMGNVTGDFELLANFYGSVTSVFWTEASKWNGQLSGYVDGNSGALTGQSSQGRYWSSTVYNANPASAYYLSVTAGSSGAINTNDAKKNGMAVRCLQDYCPVNQYMSNGQCQSCQAHSLSEMGSTSANDCICDYGYYMSNGTCTACPANKVSPRGSTSVSACVSLADVSSLLDTTNCSNPVAFMNNWNGCSSLSEFDTVCLADPRDYRTYQVRKFGDDSCWMVNELKFGGDYGQTDGCAANSGAGNFTYAWCGGNSTTGCTAGGARSFVKGQEKFASGYYGHCRSAGSNYNSYLYDWEAALQSTLAYSGSSTQFNETMQGVCPGGWHVPEYWDFNGLINTYPDVIIIEDLCDDLLNDLPCEDVEETYFWDDVAKWNPAFAGMANNNSGALSGQAQAGYYFTAASSNASSVNTFIHYY
ncbi:hypothetical protein IJJ27_02645, partial [bacterium]|nr:hypothetical protein [bacterium]